MKPIFKKGGDMRSIRIYLNALLLHKLNFIAKQLIFDTETIENATKYFAHLRKNLRENCNS